MIKNILFDLDDTILDFHKAERNALIKALESIQIYPDEKIISRYSQLNLAQWKLLEKGEITRSEVKIRRYRLLFEEFNLNHSPEAAAKYYEYYLSQGHYFISGAEETLKKLSESYRLYIVSNGTSVVQKSRIASAGIAAYMTDIFISEDIGFNKPSIDFFNFCFSKIEHFKKEETIIVGDSLSSDIAGGKNAGILTIWFNPSKEKSSEKISADYEISNISDIFSVLKNI